MLEQQVRLISENLARTMDRRRFLKRASATMFGGLAAVAAGHIVVGGASAEVRKPPPTVPNCAPPGPYCNYEGIYPPQPDACHGAACFQHLHNGQILQCRFYYAF